MAMVHVMAALMLFQVYPAAGALPNDASAKANDLQERSAFILGMADFAGNAGPWAAGGVGVSRLRKRTFSEMAKMLGIREEQPEQSPVQAEVWSRPVLQKIGTITYPTYNTIVWAQTVRGQYPERWTEGCCRKYLLGAYCSLGNAREIGPLELDRAFFLVALILRLDPDAGVTVVTSVNSTPGGSSVKLPSGRIWDQLIHESAILLGENASRQSLPEAPQTSHGADIDPPLNTP